MKACKCGSMDFLTKPNSYDIYKVINGKLEFIKSEFIEDELKLYCRECSRELKC
jgi:FixJ family two-component response regulator